MGASRFENFASQALIILLLISITMMTVLEIANSIPFETNPPDPIPDSCDSNGSSPTQITDPRYPEQWNMLVIQAAEAWQESTQDDSNVTVAVIDTGVDLDNLDLACGIIQVGNDYVDDDSVPNDENGHGTHVAGIIAADLNGIGVVGVAPYAEVLPVRVLGKDGSGYTSDIASAIRWAADRAQILSLSLGSAYNNYTDPILKAAVDYAVNTKGRLVVAAAGNNGASGNAPTYPGAYPNVFAVGAVTAADERANFSNYGSYIDITAPGVGILSTYLADDYRIYSGTSMATPHVSGLAALIWSKYPSLNADQIRYAITSSAVDLGAPGLDIYYGWGRIDAMAALNAAASIASGATVIPAVETDDKTVEIVTDNREADILEGYVLVQFDTSTTAKSVEESVAKLAGAAIDKTLPELNTIRLTVPVGEEWATIDALRQRSDVLYAGPEYIYQMIDPIESDVTGD